MKLFRNLLFWLALALVGALLAQLLVQDPGYVLVRYRGTDYSTTLAVAVALLLLTWAALWLLWKLITLPFDAVRRRRANAIRQRLLDGLDAVHHGHWQRAEKALAQALQADDATAVARVAGARAASARGDSTTASAHLDALGERHPVSAALARADLALAAGRPHEALQVLDAPAAQPLPPRGLALRAQALAASGRAGEAYGLLGALRQQQALPASELDALETHWAEHGLREATDANVLADRWDALPKPLRSHPGAVAAYAERAAALRWEDAAAGSVEHALEAAWDESLAALYGRLPIGRFDARRAHAERWLQAHPASPGLLLSLARLALAQGQWPQAEGFLHRALAQGAGSEAWEALGDGFTRAGDDSRARQSYANALAATRGDSVNDLPGRDLRQKIFDQAVGEERDAHGVPRLRE